MIQRITDFYRGAEIVAGSILAIATILAAGFFFFTAFVSLFMYNVMSGFVLFSTLGALTLLVPLSLIELGKWLRS